jgi:hypothetical protein
MNTIKFVVGIEEEPLDCPIKYLDSKHSKTNLTRGATAALETEFALNLAEQNKNNLLTHRGAKPSSRKPHANSARGSDPSPLAMSSFKIMASYNDASDDVITDKLYAFSLEKRVFIDR